ncbi:DUF4179 domain-containing protein [Flavonifractor sp.]|uniref:DUF4179 domain-containing protein n=1 Tax=Flavonifractor sp. TaxID=2049025 RepID=UPI0025C312B6|nr:DUF4179 domain-containing protein [Flavonifractor sp.]
MAGYRDELERLGFSGEEKAELARRLAAGRPTAERRRMRLPYRGLVAVVAAVSLLVGAAGAASLAGVSPAFRELFGITSEEQVQNLGVVHLNQVFEDKNGSGATITVKETVADSELFYALVEFAAPEGTVLPEPDQVEEGLSRARLWGDPDGEGLECWFYSDKACTKMVSVGDKGYGFDYVEDSDPADNKMNFLLRVECGESLPEEGGYCRVTEIQSLFMWLQGVWTPTVEDMDFELVIPLPECSGYSFEGRSGVNLGGVTLATVDDLTISPISVTFDLIIPDEAAYEAALAEHGPWEAYILLLDGTRVDAEFQLSLDQRDISEEPGEEGWVYFRSEHVRLALEHPIDVSQIYDIVFVGDNTKVYDGVESGETVYFSFLPSRFSNATFWDEVSGRWRNDQDQETDTGAPPISTSVPAEPAHADTP